MKWLSGSSQDHPRIRGEHRLDIPWPQGMQGSSPHTRGARRPSRPWGRARGIIPAYAGSTGGTAAPAEAPADHPRIRGEHYVNSAYPALAAGSSPHTRGALPTSCPSWRNHRIIPAYAGSTNDAGVARFREADHPRIRGEHAAALREVFGRHGSSPHTRGARDLLEILPPDNGIIPAYAGSTPARCPCRRWRRDHPRIRGEHTDAMIEGFVGNGSSPHTRGAHLEIPAIPRIAAVIIPVFLYPSPTPQEEADRSMVLLTLS